MAKLPPLSEQDRENLIAYLDGELDAKAARRLETRLNLDAEARQEAEALRRTWDMLDYLSRPAASPTFSSKTLQTVSSLRPVVKPELVRPWPLWAFAGCWAAALLLSGMLGYTGVSLVSKPAPPPAPEPQQAADLDRQLLRDLRLLENKHLFDAVDDLNFVRELDTPELFGDDG